MTRACFLHQLFSERLANSSNRRCPPRKRKSSKTSSISCQGSFACCSSDSSYHLFAASYFHVAVAPLHALSPSRSSIEMEKSVPWRCRATRRKVPHSSEEALCEHVQWPALPLQKTSSAEQNHCRHHILIDVLDNS